MTYCRALSLLVLSLLAGSYAADTLQGFIDVKRLQSILLEGTKSEDLPTLYYSVKGLQTIGAKIPDVCQTIKNAKYDLDNVEQVFYLTNAASISGCVNYLKPDVLAASTRTLDKKDAPLSELYYAVYSLKALGRGAVMNTDEALKNIVQILKKDDSPANYGYVFALCEHIGCESWTASHAEGLLLAADEVDGRALVFEGGLPVTSLLLTSIINTYKTLKKPSPLSEEQRYKFARYLLSRRSAASPRPAACLLLAAYALADDQPSPISIVVKGRTYITSEADSIEISVSDLVGRAVPSLKPEEVVAQSGTRLTDDVVVLSKQPLTQNSDDPTTFVLNLSKIKSRYGVYKIALAAGSKTTNVFVTVLGEIRVTSIEVGIGDVDGTTSPKITTVAYPDQLTEKLQADHLQKLSLKFTVRDQQDKPVLVQQAFVRFAPAAGPDDAEAIFVAEPDNHKAYKVELNVGTLSKHLSTGPGEYSVSVYLGDSAAASPIAWDLGLFKLNFGEAKATPGARRGPLPEIRHQFRAAEPRPPRAVSDVFAAACAAPLLLLLVLWARLRVNLANFPFTLSALVFHLALGASLALYGVLWVRLTMFETVRYLLPLGAITFLAGHRLLRTLVTLKHK